MNIAATIVWNYWETSFKYSIDIRIREYLKYNFTDIIITIQLLNEYKQHVITVRNLGKALFIR